MILNLYIPKERVSKYVRQELIELQGEIHESTIRVGDFNTFLSEIFSRQKISEDGVELNAINLLWTRVDCFI